MTNRNKLENSCFLNLAPQSIFKPAFHGSACAPSATGGRFAPFQSGVHFFVQTQYASTEYVRIFSLPKISATEIVILLCPLGIAISPKSCRFLSG